MARPSRRATQRRARAYYAVLAAALVPGPIDVVVYAGNSNTVGQAADVANLSWTDDPNILTWTGDAVTKVVPFTRTRITVPNAAPGAEGRFGFAAQFARLYRALNPTKPVMIIDGARAGSYQSFYSGTTAADNSWDTSSGTLTSHLITETTQALAALVSAGWTPTVRWVVDGGLGTNDASNANTAPLVEAAKTAMYAAFRAAAWYTSAAAILDCRTRVEATGLPQLAIVRAAQAKVANLAADVILVDLDGLTNNPGDLVHFDLAGIQGGAGRQHDAANDRLALRVARIGGAKIKVFIDTNNAANLTQASGVASAINDQVGNFNLVQGTPGARPPVTTAGGRTVLSFDGSDDGLKQNAATSLGFSGVREWFALVKNTAPLADANSRVAYCRGGGTSQTGIRIARTIDAGVVRFRTSLGYGASLNAFAIDNTVDAADGLWHVVRGRFDPAAGTYGTLYISVDGNPEVASVLPAAYVVTDVSLIFGNGNSQVWLGQLRAAIEAVGLTTQDRTDLMADLMAERAVMNAA